MNPVGITLLMLTAFGGFFYLAWRKLAIVVALKPEVRWDDPRARLKELVENGFLQARMIRGERKPGIMHAVIFAGFLALARAEAAADRGRLRRERSCTRARSASRSPSARTGSKSRCWLAVGYAFFRRLVQKPARLERNREALVILSLIAAIMITDFLFDGFRFALVAGTDSGIAHEARYAVRRRGDRAGTCGDRPACAATSVIELSYWVQMVTVFSFLVLLPVGEHFHIVTALPGALLRPARADRTACRPSISTR